jgi:hypothetical protein
MGGDFEGEARIEGRQIADGQVGEDAVDELRREFTHAPVPCGPRSWLCCPKEVIALQAREPRSFGARVFNRIAVNSTERGGHSHEEPTY